MAFGQMVKLLEGLAQDQVAVQLETEKTSKGFLHIIEARTTASLMRDAITPTPPLEGRDSFLMATIRELIKEIQLAIRDGDLPPAIARGYPQYAHGHDRELQ